MSFLFAGFWEEKERAREKINSKCNRVEGSLLWHTCSFSGLLFLRPDAVRYLLLSDDIWFIQWWEKNRRDLKSSQRRCLFPKLGFPFLPHFFLLLLEFVFSVTTTAKRVTSTAILFEEIIFSTGPIRLIFFLPPSSLPVPACHSLSSYLKVKIRKRFFACTTWLFVKKNTHIPHSNKRKKTRDKFAPMQRHEEREEQRRTTDENIRSDDTCAGLRIDGKKERAERKRSKEKREQRREGEIRSQGHFISTHSESQVGEQRAVTADRTTAGSMRFNDLSLTSASRSRKKFIVFQRVCEWVYVDVWVSECMYAVSCREKGESSGHCTQGRKDFGFTFCRPPFSSDQEMCELCYAKKKKAVPVPLFSLPSAKVRLNACREAFPFPAASWTGSR